MYLWFLSFQPQSSIFPHLAHAKFQVDSQSSIMEVPKCRFRLNIRPLHSVKMTEFFVICLRITIFLLRNTKLLYILLKLMEYGYIILLIIQRFWCSVYRVFIIAMYTKNSLLEIIYISFEYLQFSDREKWWRHSVFSCFSATPDIFQSDLKILIYT